MGSTNRDAGLSALDSGEPDAVSVATTDGPAQVATDAALASDGYWGPPPPDGNWGPPPDGNWGPPPDGSWGPPRDGNWGSPPDGRSGPPPASNLEQAVDRLDFVRPSWDDLRRWATGVSRKVPTFSKAYPLLPEYFGMGANDVRGQLNASATVARAHPINVSSLKNSNIVPPLGFGPEHKYPYSDSVHDERLRSAATMMLMEKNRNAAVMLLFVAGYDPIPQFVTGDEFKSWVEQKVLPRFVAQAKAAELVKAEYYGPFPAEIESFLNKALQPKLALLPPAERLALAQYWVQRTLETVRPHFSGVLVAHSYSNYGWEGDVYAGISFAGYDEIHFTLSPGCDLEGTSIYLDQQLKRYEAIAARSTGARWAIGELWVQPKLFKDACQTDYSAIEGELFSLILRKVHMLATQPIGMWVDYNPDDQNGKQTLSAAALSVVDNYFKQH